MNVLAVLIKLLILSVFAAITLGFGAGGTFGLFFSFAEHRFDGEIIALSLGGLALMCLFGWAAWTLVKVLFPSRPNRARDDDSSGGFFA